MLQRMKWFQETVLWGSCPTDFGVLAPARRLFCPGRGGTQPVLLLRQGETVGPLAEQKGLWTPSSLSVIMSGESGDGSRSQWPTQSGKNQPVNDWTSGSAKAQGAEGDGDFASSGRTLRSAGEDELARRTERASSRTRRPRDGYSGSSGAEKRAGHHVNTASGRRGPASVPDSGAGCRGGADGVCDGTSRDETAQLGKHAGESLLTAGPKDSQGRSGSDEAIAAKLQPPPTRLPAKGKEYRSEEKRRAASTGPTTTRAGGAGVGARGGKVEGTRARGGAAAAGLKGRRDGPNAGSTAGGRSGAKLGGEVQRSVARGRWGGRGGKAGRGGGWKAGAREANGSKGSASGAAPMQGQTATPLPAEAWRLAAGGIVPNAIARGAMPSSGAGGAETPADGDVDAKGGEQVESSWIQQNAKSPTSETQGEETGADVRMVDKRVRKFWEATRARQRAIAQARAARWRELEARLKAQEQGKEVQEPAGTETPEDQRGNATDDFWGLRDTLGHSQRGTGPYAESLAESAMVQVARWTKQVSMVDALFRPIDRALDLIDALSRRTRAAPELPPPAEPSGARSKAAAGAVDGPREVPQGDKYPDAITEGLMSRDGTVYAMPTGRGGKITRKRKELRVRQVRRAWFGNPSYPWQTEVSDTDGTWATVGVDVTAQVRAVAAKGVVSLDFPLGDSFPDPCPGAFKALFIDYLTPGGSKQSVVWPDDAAGGPSSWLATMRTTHSLRRLANIVAGDRSVDVAIEETVPLITALRQNLFPEVPRPSSSDAGSGMATSYPAPVVEAPRSLAEGRRGISQDSQDSGRVRWESRAQREMVVEGSSFELEARLGTWVPGEEARGTTARFANGVSREFMDRVLDLCQGWDDWSAAEGWREMHDYIFRIGNAQVRTTVGFDPSTGQASSRTVHKKILKIRDYAYVPTIGEGPRISLLAADVRVALSEERVIRESSLPKWGPARVPLRVRIKQRRSFYYTPARQEGRSGDVSATEAVGKKDAVWRFDFTLVWSARTLAQAQRLQQTVLPSAPICPSRLMKFNMRRGLVLVHC